MACPIQHVVVLVQENRSFDHILGWMKAINPEIDGVTGKESNPLPEPPALSSNSQTHLYFRNDAVYVDPDPDHSFEAIYEQVFGKKWSSDNSTTEKLIPTMDGFVRNAEARAAGLGEIVMNGFKPESVPVFKQLVSEFAVCDRWFSSLPDATQPNRLFVHAATSHGATGNDTKQLLKGFPQKTIFESLHEAGRTFGIYYAYPPSTLFYRNLRKPKYLHHFHQYDLSFKRHCREGKLPNYTVIEQRYFELGHLPGNDDHPTHDISEGQKFVKEVYEELRGSPLWNQILFIVVYDEHGGFYDHVPTPVEGVPNPDGLTGPEPYNFKFDRLGVRVPAILISPWIQPGTVLHEPSGPYPTSQFEHSSIPATVKKIFNLNNFLTKRDEWAGTFDCVLTRTTPRDDCPVTLDEPIVLRETGPKEGEKLNDFQQQLVQMAAGLKGDHEKEALEKLVDNMNVGDAVKYVGSSLDVFFEKLKNKVMENGQDSDQEVLEEEGKHTRTTKTVVQRMLSCLICDN